MRFPRTVATPFVLATRNETPTTDQKHLPALTHRQTKHPTSPYNKKRLCYIQTQTRLKFAESLVPIC